MTRSPAPSSAPTAASTAEGAPAADLLSALRTAFGPEPIQHVQTLTPRAGHTADWPAWVPGDLRDALAARGIERPWLHQVQAAEMAYDGKHVVISTGTASGKSLAYQLPILSTLLTEPKACALYLAPTKALAADQLESLRAFPLPAIRPAAYDGDTPLPDRAWARDHGRLLLTNPDMLHLGMLPYHARWTRLLSNLRYIVVDECHSYRGVFGSHVALVLRRLARLAAYYGSAPRFILASATVSHPGEVAGRLVGAEVAEVTEDTAPHPGAAFVLWEPPLLPDDDAIDPDLEVENDWYSGSFDDAGSLLDTPATSESVKTPVRRSAAAEAARIMATLVTAGARTLTFVRSRAGAEQVALMAQRAVERVSPRLASKVSAYRGGYLPEDRREVERAFDAGELVGVASTNALELGVDIAGIDATVLAGYPGTLASLWQQAGRAGRGSTPALVTFVARDDPLDSYLVHHPDSIFAKPMESAVINPANPYVLTPHLACAAAEIRLTAADLALFGGDAASEALEALIAERVVRRRPAGYFYTGHKHPADSVSLRGSAQQIAVVEATTARMLGTEDAARAPASIHPGAVYVHQGRTYVVQSLDLDGGVALVDADRPDWFTNARSVSSVEILSAAETRALPTDITLNVGSVRVTEQVIGYVRRRGDGKLIDTLGLDMPEQVLDTRAVWYTIGAESLRAAGILDATLGGALHAAEHAAIGLLPLFAGCDRWDIGGLSTALHADTGEPTVIVYDGAAGGAGFAEHGFAVAAEWLTATRDAVASCPCAAGCPSCIQSPKCGNGNNPLHKAGAVTVLGMIAAALDAGGQGDEHDC